MKRTGVAVLLLVLATGCHRKHDDGTPVGVGGMLPGSCVTSVGHYAGAVVANPATLGGDDRLTIATNANVLDYPSDRIDAYICKNAANCGTSRPAVTCAVTWDQPSAPCYSTLPSINILFGRNSVQLLNAAEAGYTTYDIATEVCR